MIANRTRNRQVLFRRILLIVNVVVIVVAALVVTHSFRSQRRIAAINDKFFRDLYFLEKDPHLGWRVRPGFGNVFSVGPYNFSMQTNSQGIRDHREYQVDRTPNKLRVLCLGDSNMFGLFCDQGDDLPSQLESQLGAVGISSEVINAAVPGYRIWQTNDSYRTKWHTYKPDIIVVYVGVNESQISRHRVFSDRVATDYPAVKEDYKALLQTLADDCLVICCTATSQTDAVEIDNINKALKEVAEHENVTLVDVDQFFRQHGRKNEWYCEADKLLELVFHPNKKGNEQIAILLRDVILKSPPAASLLRD